MVNKSRHRQVVSLLDEVKLLRPEDDARALIDDGLVLVSGTIERNPEHPIRKGTSVTVLHRVAPRGEEKLSNALTTFNVPVSGKVALEAGAATGGFTRALLRSGARRVYAVDVGHGQLLGSLRQDARVVNLEATNLSELDRERVPDVIELITLDLSYLSLADAVPQLDRVKLDDDALLVALVKPMFELHLASPPSDEERLAEAVERAKTGIRAAGWRTIDSIRSPMLGSRGAIEFFVYARREPRLHSSAVSSENRL